MVLTQLVSSIRDALSKLREEPSEQEHSQRALRLLNELRNQAPTHSSELARSAYNLISSLQEGILNGDVGVPEVLDDLIDYLNMVFVDGVEKGSSLPLIDELMERMDYLASGGRDVEVPRKSEAESRPPTEFTKIELPIDFPSEYENPELAESVQGIRKNARLQTVLSQVASRKSGHSSVVQTYLLEQQDLLGRAYRSQLDALLRVTLPKLASKVETSLSSICESAGEESRKTFTVKANPGFLFKSTAVELLPKLEESIIECFSRSTARDDAVPVTVEFDSTADEVCIEVQARALNPPLSNFSERVLQREYHGMDASWKRPSWEEFLQDPTFNDDSLTQSMGELSVVVKFLGGKVNLNCKKGRHLQFVVELPHDVRVSRIALLRLNGRLIGIQAHQIAAIVPACVADCDTKERMIIHEGVEYRYCTTKDSKELHEIDSSDWGLVVLMDIQDQKLALRVDQFVEVRPYSIKPSSSSVTFGNAATQTEHSDLFVEIDPITLSQSDFQRSARPRLQNRPLRIQFMNVSDQVRRKFENALVGTNSMCYESTGFSESIRSFQEHRPDFLIVDDHDLNVKPWNFVQKLQSELRTDTLGVVFFTDQDEVEHRLELSEWGSVKFFPHDTGRVEISHFLRQIRDP